jgi:hypothetical protein
MILGWVDLGIPSPHSVASASPSARWGASGAQGTFDRPSGASDGATFGWRERATSCVGIGRGFVQRRELVLEAARGRNCAPAGTGGYPPRKIAGAQDAWLLERIEESFTLRGLVAELADRDLKVDYLTVWKFEVLPEDWILTEAPICG